MQQNRRTYKQILTTLILIAFFSAMPGFAETVTGGGYVLEQVVTPVSGALSGNGFTVVQTSDVISGGVSSGAFTMISPFGGSSTPSTGGSSGGGGGGGGGGGYYILPPYIVATTTVTTGTATTTPPKKNKDSLLTPNGSTCSTRVVFSAPIDIGSPHNVKEDVEKLENFLNTYEKEKLPVNGVYEPRDIAAVKRWQAKYKSLILTPMKLKNPTGTVYTLSQRQVERQSTSSCGKPVIVNTCPFFTTYVKYGDEGSEVKKVQQFLNITQGEKLTINGVFGPATRNAVLKFQRLHRKDIVSIVTLSFVSGNWNVSTRTKANEVIGCDKLK